jgi:hypothetical protein
MAAISCSPSTLESVNTLLGSRRIQMAFKLHNCLLREQRLGLLADVCVPKAILFQDLNPSRLAGRITPEQVE